MIEDLVGKQQSDEYKPEVLCPEYAEILNDPTTTIGTKEQNIKAIEAYAIAICKKLAANLQKKYDATIVDHTPEPIPTAAPIIMPTQTTKPALSEHVRNHLEKVAAKNFTPTFKGGNQPLSFDTIINHAKFTTEKYANITKEGKNPDEFVNSQAAQRDKDKFIQKNQDINKYKELVKARIEVYKGFEFIEDPEDQNKFMLRNIAANQNIIVTKNPTTGKLLIQAESTDPINDETLGIMVELLHSVLRFSEPNKKMNVKIKDVDANSEITKKIEEGLTIITKDNQEIKNKLNYKSSEK